MKYVLEGFYWHPNGYRQDKKFRLEFNTEAELKAAQSALAQVRKCVSFKTNLEVPLNVPEHVGCGNGLRH